MSIVVSLRLSPETYSALARIQKTYGEKTTTHTIRRIIAQGLNENIVNSHQEEILERLVRIESNTSVLKEVELF